MDAIELDALVETLAALQHATGEERRTFLRENPEALQAAKLLAAKIRENDALSYYLAD